MTIRRPPAEMPDDDDRKRRAAWPAWMVASWAITLRVALLVVVIIVVMAFCSWAFQAPLTLGPLHVGAS